MKEGETKQTESVLTYHGNIEPLKIQLDDRRDFIEQSIKSVIGENRYHRLEKLTRELIVPEMFVENPSEGIGNGEVFNLAGNDSNLFIPIASANDVKRFSIGDNGKLKYKFSRTLRGCPAIHLSDKGFELYKETIGTDQPGGILSYIHEFSHFILYGIQSIPPSSLVPLVLKELKSRGIDGDSPEKLYGHLFVHDCDAPTKELIWLFHDLALMEESYACALESNIWGNVGTYIDRDRIKQKILTMDITQFSRVPNTYKFVDKAFDDIEKSQESVWDWHRFIVPETYFRKTLYESLGNNLKFVRQPITEFYGFT
ncbi:MAG: hypothetical protein V1802_03215 [Candidatus Aenigmatarchaeota archaeon]